MGYLETKSLVTERYKQYVDELEELKKDLKIATDIKDHKLIKYYKNLIEDRLKITKSLKYEKENMREEEPKDKAIRDQIKDEYASVLKSVIPEGTDINFYGVSNLDTVRDIIKFGTLKADDEIKYNISTSINEVRRSLFNAEYRNNQYLPYGALFAFKKSENGIFWDFNFKEEPSMLYSIITTEECVPRIQNMCLEYGVDMDKVCTHEEFKIKCMNFDKEFKPKSK